VVQDDLLLGHGVQLAERCRNRNLAFWSATHVFPDDGDPLFTEIQDIYDEIGEALPPGASRPRPGALPDDQAETEHGGLLRDGVTRDFDWEISYTAEEYLRLLDTFSGHIAMHPRKRDRLYSEIRRSLDRMAVYAAAGEPSCTPPVDPAQSPLCRRTVQAATSSVWSRIAVSVASS